MTKAEKTSIVERVKWIFNKRAKTKELNMDINKLNGRIAFISDETVGVIKALKIDMGGATQMNIKIEDNYYSLTQSGATVEIEPLIIEIEL